MHLFRIDALADPQSLPRIAGFFAQRALIPSAMRMRMLRRHMRIELTVADIADDRAAVIAAKLREIVAVLSVDLATERAAAA
ncbi:MAG: hypothetical protein DI569_01835 [Sphingopyxis macrogoltabida]|uniref:ACT domain-containing protein n=1 Tax=Sphingopyxis macrogoltabida TaxID=33050 RepID=A0A2W5LBX9_SPHMC|nr:MAG: hypothetical protein DI569_01835 [Sphingopyxis macrogoltabida]